MKPKWIKDAYECNVCNEEMELESYFLSDDKKSVEVWYRCKEHGLFGLRYTNKFVDSFKKDSEECEGKGFAYSAENYDSGSV